MWRKLITLLAMGIFSFGWAEEIDVADLVSSCERKMKEISEKYKYIENLPREEREREIGKKEAEKRSYFQSLGPEKVYILAIEADKRDPEAAYWILFYGFSPEDPKLALFSYLYSNKFRDKMNLGFRTWTEEGWRFYFQNMNFQRQKNDMNEGLKFLIDPQNSTEHKAIVMQFPWDVWSGFFPRVEKMEKKGEIYEEMNKQVLQVIEFTSRFRQDSVLAPKVTELLKNFDTVYSREDLPVDFKNSPSYLKVSQILKTYAK